ncbi:MAG TPA: patatin-like phospholipase family protein [Spirochaetia bacterium]|nr:patatin-like phospholipase family protein [Spirochaetia bacterium]
MSMKPLRRNVGIAVDGGGIKGLVVARALVALEEELRCKSLVTSPQIKVLAGTSTGAILTASIAIGMTAVDIARAYRDMGQKIFPSLIPPWFPDPLKDADELIRSILQRSIYSNKQLIEVLRSSIQKQTHKADLSLAELNEMLGPDKALILTTVNITERRTCFLKSYEPSDGEWKLWEAVVASSSVPPALPVWTRLENGKRTYYTDGGVGSYTNPAFVAAREATLFRGYPARDVSILSFGTGWVGSDNYRKENGTPTDWRGLDWARNAPNLFLGDAIRSQSLDVMESSDTREVDFRRFQFELDRDIPADTFVSDAAYARMEQLGDDVGARIRENHFAPNPVREFDPEGLYALRNKYLAARGGPRHRAGEFVRRLWRGLK